MQIDAHHHLWDLQAVQYPWLMERGAPRFFGDPTPIQRNYLLPEFRADAEVQGFTASVHIQVGAADAWHEAQWVQSVADANPDWPLVQVVYCDVTADDLVEQLKKFKTLPSVRGVRQIIGRAPGEDAQTGTNDLLDNPAFLDGLKRLPDHSLSFDLQLLPELMQRTSDVLARTPDTAVALCHAGSPHDRSEKGLAFWKRELSALAEQSQIACKLSGLGMFEHGWTKESLAPIISECLEQFGAEQCMFGSNFPVDSLTSDYAQLIDLHRAICPPDVLENTFSRTAQGFYSF